MAYLCKYCYQRFNSKKRMVLMNCPKSPTGKHAPAGAAIKGTYILGILAGIIFGIVELFKYLNISEKITALINTISGKLDLIVDWLRNI